MKDVAAFFTGVGLCGACFAFILGIVFHDDRLLSGAQWDYTQCLAIGAPQQNCLDKFLLPKP